MENVAYNCRMLAQSLQFSPDFPEEISEGFIATIEVASWLHDIGKLRVPIDGIEEVRQEAQDEQPVRHHAEQGAEILERVYQNTPENSFLPMAIEIARYHHACWDGSWLSKQYLRERDSALRQNCFCRRQLRYDDRRRRAGEGLQPGGVHSDNKGRSGTHFDPDIVNVLVKIRNQLRHS